MKWEFSQLNRCLTVTFSFETSENFWITKTLTSLKGFETAFAGKVGKTNQNNEKCKRNVLWDEWLRWGDVESLEKWKIFLSKILRVGENSALQFHCEVSRAMIMNEFSCMEIKIVQSKVIVENSLRIDKSEYKNAVLTCELWMNKAIDGKMQWKTNFWVERPWKQGKFKM